MLTISEYLACEHLGVDPQNVPFIKGAVEGFNNESDPEYGAFDRETAKLAAAMFLAAGKKLEPEYALYSTLSKAAAWSPVYSEIVQPVYEALARDAGGFISAHKEALSKSAGATAIPVLGSVISGLGNAVGSVPAMAKTMLGLGAAGGGALGTLLWAVNRHATQNDADTQALIEQAKHYNRITSEIQADLRRKGVVSDPQKQKLVDADAGITDQF